MWRAIHPKHPRPGSHTDQLPKCSWSRTAGLQAPRARVRPALSLKHRTCHPAWRCQRGVRCAENRKVQPRQQPHQATRAAVASNHVRQGQGRPWEQCACHFTHASNRFAFPQERHRALKVQRIEEIGATTNATARLRALNPFPRGFRCSSALPGFSGPRNIEFRVWMAAGGRSGV